MAQENRQPLSYWGTVGAVVVASIATGVVTTVISYVFAGFVAKRAATSALEGAGITPGMNGLPRGNGPSTLQ